MLNVGSCPETILLGYLALPFLWAVHPGFNSTDTCSRLPRGLSGKESAFQAGDMGSIPGSGRSPGEGNSNPLQYSCLGNPMDRGAWWPTVQGVAKSRT